MNGFPALCAGQSLPRLVCVSRYLLNTAAELSWLLRKHSWRVSGGLLWNFSNIRKNWVTSLPSSYKGVIRLHKVGLRFLLQHWTTYLFCFLTASGMCGWPQI